MLIKDYTPTPLYSHFSVSHFNLKQYKGQVDIDSKGIRPSEPSVKLCLSHPIDRERLDGYFLDINTTSNAASLVFSMCVCAYAMYIVCQTFEMKIRDMFYHWLRLFRSEYGMQELGWTKIVLWSIGICQLS